MALPRCYCVSALGEGIRAIFVAWLLSYEKTSALIVLFGGEMDWMVRHDRLFCCSFCCCRWTVFNPFTIFTFSWRYPAFSNACSFCLPGCKRMGIPSWR